MVTKEMVRKWTANGKEMVRKLIANGKEMVRKWTANGKEMVRKCAYCALITALAYRFLFDFHPKDIAHFSTGKFPVFLLSFLSLFLLAVPPDKSTAFA